jgi:hypothetical protein
VSHAEGAPEDEVSLIAHHPKAPRHLRGSCTCPDFCFGAEHLVVAPWSTACAACAVGSALQPALHALHRFDFRSVPTVNMTMVRDNAASLPGHADAASVTPFRLRRLPARVPGGIIQRAAQ